MDLLSSLESKLIGVSDGLKDDMIVLFSMEFRIAKDDSKAGLYEQPSQSSRNKQSWKSRQK